MFLGAVEGAIERDLSNESTYQELVEELRQRPLEARRLVRKQFWKLSLAYIVFINKTVSINVKQFHIFMMWLLFEMCG